MSDDKGKEIPDPTPVAIPVRFRSAVQDGDRLRGMMQNLIADMRGREHVESFEESLDFEDDEDDDPLSLGETRYMKEEKLLTEHREVSNMVSRRVQDANFKRRLNHGKDRAVEGGGERGARGVGRVAEERGADDESGGRAGGGAKGGEGVSGAGVGGDGKG